MPFLCRLGLHRWKKGRRVKGFVVRRCGACPARQEQSFPGGGWKAVPRTKRVRRKPEHFVDPPLLSSSETVEMSQAVKHSEGGL